MIRQRRVLSLALVGMGLVLTNCIVLLPPIEHGEHCQFEGTSPCATCLREHCQAPIDACCSDTSCRGYSDGNGAALSALDTCGNGNQTACAGLMSTLKYDKEGAVASCLASSCKNECAGDAKLSLPSPPWSCASTRTEDGACAKCIYDSCGDAVTSCCGDTTCSKFSPMPDVMGACVGGDKPGCLYQIASSTYGGRGTSAGELGVLEGCVATKCSGACLPVDGRMHNTCTTGDYGSSCACSASATSSGSCDAKKVGGETCVLGLGGCTCGTYGCDVEGSTSGRCTCAFGAPAGGTSCRQARADDHCCLTLSANAVSCVCQSTSCMNEYNEYDIESCDKEIVMDRLTANGRVATECSN